MEGHERSKPMGGEDLKVQHFKQDDITCGFRERAGQSQAWEFPRVAMVLPCQEGMASIGRAEVGILVAKRPRTLALPYLQP